MRDDSERAVRSGARSGARGRSGRAARSRRGAPRSDASRVRRRGWRIPFAERYRARTL